MSKVESREKAPVVSTDPNSPEAQLARSAAEIQYQSKADSVYDAVLERFGNYKRFKYTRTSSSRQTVVLSSIAIILGVVLLALVQKRR